jgi:hypothetical protein
VTTVTPVPKQPRHVRSSKVFSGNSRGASLRKPWIVYDFARGDQRRVFSDINRAPSTTAGDEK